MWEFCCIIFIEYMVAGKTLLDYTNLFSSTNYRNNDNIYIYIYISTLKTNMAKEDVSLEFRLKNR